MTHEEAKERLCPISMIQSMSGMTTSDKWESGRVEGPYSSSPQHCVGQKCMFWTEGWGCGMTKMFWDVQAKKIKEQYER
jgi:hypothetical protein